MILGAAATAIDISDNNFVANIGEQLRARYGFFMSQLASSKSLQCNLRAYKSQGI